MKLASFVSAAALAAGLVLAVEAQAFTFDNHSLQRADGSARFQDPDEALTEGTSSPQSRFQFNFGGSGPNASSADSRFVPSGNAAFSSPYSGQSTTLDTVLNRHP
jgi:hypothetical protein